MDKDLMVMLAAALPPIEIIKKLEIAIERYKDAYLIDEESSDLNRAHQEVLAMSYMIILNKETKGTQKGAIEVIKKMDTLDQREKLFDLDGMKN